MLKTLLVRQDTWLPKLCAVRITQLVSITLLLVLWLSNACSVEDLMLENLAKKSETTSYRNKFKLRDKMYPEDGQLKLQILLIKWSKENRKTDLEQMAQMKLKIIPGWPISNGKTSTKKKWDLHLSHRYRTILTRKTSMKNGKTSKILNLKNSSQILEERVFRRYLTDTIMIINWPPLPTIKLKSTPEA